jgi:hypothetical protein
LKLRRLAPGKLDADAARGFGGWWRTTDGAQRVTWAAWGVTQWANQALALPGFNQEVKRTEVASLVGAPTRSATGCGGACLMGTPYCSLRGHGGML